MKIPFRKAQVANFHVGVAHVAMRKLGFILILSSADEKTQCIPQTVLVPPRNGVSTPKESTECSASVDDITHHTHDSGDWNLGDKLTNEIWIRKDDPELAEDDPKLGEEWKVVPKSAKVDLISTTNLILKSDPDLTEGKRTKETSVPPRSVVHATIRLKDDKKTKGVISTAHVGGGRFADQFLIDQGIFKEREEQTKKIVEALQREATPS